MVKLRLFLIFVLLIPASWSFTQTKSVYRTNNGRIGFVSVAPMETIKAASNELKGIIDTSNNEFAFSIYTSSFKGFNSALQQQHFYENYMESGYFPVSTFTGKIIESVDYNSNGTMWVRAKGILFIHGVKVEKIIRCKLEISDGKMNINSEFQVTLLDFDIKVPRIVNQKIAPDITVTLKAMLVLQNI